MDEDGYVNVFTDGACSSNGYKNARAGIGVWFRDNHPLYILFFNLVHCLLKLNESVRNIIFVEIYLNR